ncbi:hypothetical protein R6Q59_013031 [Mikania micrantha]
MARALTFQYGVRGSNLSGDKFEGHQVKGQLVFIQGLILMGGEGLPIQRGSCTLRGYKFSRRLEECDLERSLPKGFHLHDSAAVGNSILQNQMSRLPVFIAPSYLRRLTMSPPIVPRDGSNSSEKKSSTMSRCWKSMQRIQC